jgi:hypothetical protein
VGVTVILETYTTNPAAPTTRVTTDNSAAVDRYNALADIASAAPAATTLRAVASAGATTLRCTGQFAFIPGAIV